MWKIRIVSLFITETELFIIVNRKLIFVYQNESFDSNPALSRGDGGKSSGFIVHSKNELRNYSYTIHGQWSFGTELTSEFCIYH